MQLRLEVSLRFDAWEQDSVQAIGGLANNGTLDRGKQTAFTWRIESKMQQLGQSDSTVKVKLLKG